MWGKLPSGLQISIIAQLIQKVNTYPILPISTKGILL